MDQDSEIGTLVRAARLEKKLSQPELAKRVGTTQQTIEKIGKGTIKHSSYLPPIAEELGIAIGKVVRNSRVSQQVELPGNARLGAPVEGFTRVPLRGRGMGGKDGVLIFDTGEQPEYVEAPAKLHGVPGAYAVYVVGDSMLERYANGEIVFVHPRLPLSKGDYCVIQVSTDGEATVNAWVKRFVFFDDKSLKVEQLNPKKLLTFPAKTVRAVHKIVMGGSV